MQLFFLIEPGPYFILHPETCFGGTQALQKEELFLIFLWVIEEEMHMLHFSKRWTFFFQLNIDADCYFTAMLPRGFLYNNNNINNN